MPGGKPCNALRLLRSSTVLVVPVTEENRQNRTNGNGNKDIDREAGKNRVELGNLLYEEAVADKEEVKGRDGNRHKAPAALEVGIDTRPSHG